MYGHANHRPRIYASQVGIERDTAVGGDHDASDHASLLNVGVPMAQAESMLTLARRPPA